MVVLRGPLGVGKTTIARALGRVLRAQVISIDPLLERWPWDGGSLSLFLRANRLAVREARRSLALGRPVVVEGNFYWKGALRDLERRLPCPCSVFTLEAPLRVCIARDQGRPLAHGAQGAREVYAKCSRFTVGPRIDAQRPVEESIREVRRRLATSPGRLHRPRART